MTSIHRQWDKAAAPSLKRWWARRGDTVLRAVIAVMAIAALRWLDDRPSSGSSPSSFSTGEPGPSGR